MTGIYFHMRLEFRTAADRDRWTDAGLATQRDSLADAPGFASLDLGDDDLLGGELSVAGQTHLDRALAYLDEIDFSLDEELITGCSAYFTIDGQPAVRILTAGVLPRGATVGDLLDHLSSSGVAGGIVEYLAQDEDTALTVHGFLPDYYTYRDYRLPMIYAGSAASRWGARGSVSFVGPADGEYVVTFADFSGGSAEISEPDPQDVTERDLSRRFRGIDRETLYNTWRSSGAR
ncbi:hypothetical protein [Streptomyces sp. NPDC057675]|uniref:hypothetical protein n=1 Tax=Streptomyces sp. NPDC057675 TaxID=3346204 RepID=UPI0036744AC2